MFEYACVVLDWKRPQNMGRVVDGIRKQSLENHLYIVHVENDRKVDEATNITLDVNYGPGVEFSILPIIHEPYTIFLDDDIGMTDPEYFSILGSAVKKYDYTGCVGVMLGDDKAKPYTSGGKTYSPKEQFEADIVLANLFAMNTYRAAYVWSKYIAIIRSLQYRWPGFITNEDCMMSLLWQHEYGRKPVAVGTGEKPYEILSTKHGLEHDPDHYIQRDAVCKCIIDILNPKRGKPDA